MGSIRIIAGSLKGRNMPYPKSRFGDAGITPQKVKEALFSIIGDDLDGKSFLDLYGGTGQIGFEALSRGANPVAIIEQEKWSCSSIREFAQGTGLSDRLMILNYHASRALRYLRKKGISFNFIFIDPPYVKIKGAVGLYGTILKELEGENSLAADGLIFIQHFSGNVLKESLGCFGKIDVRKYGSNWISIYARKSG